MSKFKRTLCASCKNMWDGFGLTCPRHECSAETTKCDHYERMTDHELLTFAPRFWNDTFFDRWNDCQLNDDRLVKWQPVRPLLSEITPKQQTLF